MPKLYPLNIKHLHDASVLCCLGQGTYGNVKLYICKDQEISNTGEFKECSKCFVVKQIKKKFNYFWNINKSKDEDCRIKKALLNEFTIGSLLHHPNIRETLDIDLIDNCIIFEYCNGNTLYDYIKSLDNLDNFYLNIKLQDYFKQMTCAIEYIHNNDVAHLDLKLENIMITNDVIKIIDFGESCFCKNKISGIHGTNSYIAPEEFITKEFDGKKVDIWALCIILYVMIFKRFPWKIAKNTDEHYKKFIILYDNRELNNFLKQDTHRPSIQYLFENMLNPNPKKRCNIKDISDILKVC